MLKAFFPWGYHYKESVKTSRFRGWVVYLRHQFNVSIVFACEMARQSRSFFITNINSTRWWVYRLMTSIALLEHCQNWRLPKLLKRLHNKRKPWKVYNMLKLNLRRKRKRRVATRSTEPLSTPLQHNEYWSMDYMSYALSYWHRFGTLYILDDFNWQVLAIMVSGSLTTKGVVTTLNRS